MSAAAEHIDARCAFLVERIDEVRESAANYRRLADVADSQIESLRAELGDWNRLRSLASAERHARGEWEAS